MQRIPTTICAALTLITRALLACVLVAVVCVAPAFAQHPPTIGYMYPPGGRAGETVEVTLGGYDWTPDMETFVHDPRVKIEIIGTPSSIIVPEPPYWFGKKARRPPFLLPRETKARITISKDAPPGIIRWQVANANGASPPGFLVIGTNREVIEADDRTTAQQLESLPVTVSGQIKKIEEVDRFRFAASKTGPISLSLCARKIGSMLNAVLEVYNDGGDLVASAADTAGRDTAITFVGIAKQEYTVHVYDLDFRGNRAFTYRLNFSEGPRVVAAIPPVGRRGETRDVEFIGYGIASGQAKLESVVQRVTFPSDKEQATFAFPLQTKFGTAEPFELCMSDLAEVVRTTEETMAIPTLPAAITGVLKNKFGEHRYRFSAIKGDQLSLQIWAAKFGSPLDVSLAVYDATGKQVANNDDIPGSTDAALQFAAKADAEYEIGVTDVSGSSGSPAAVYRLTAKRTAPSFTFAAPELLNVPVGGTGKIALKVIRSAGFKDAIALSIVGLPDGVTAPEDLEIPASKTSLSIELTVAKEAAAAAALVRIVGEAKLADESIRFESNQMLVATTITPPFTIDAEGKDDVTKWPRGTTFPAPVLIERNEGFTDEIVLEMTSKQGRVRQGITGPELVVPNGVKRILYPVTLPEWLETTRTSRMVVNGVAKVADAKGNVRYSVVKQKTRMGFLPTGALLKLAAEVTEYSTTNPNTNQTIPVPLSISRSNQLTAPARIELMANANEAKFFSAEVIAASPDQTQLNFLIKLAADLPQGEYELRIRATVMQNENLPVVAETTILVQHP
jgi:hypothetical protein